MRFLSVCFVCFICTLPCRNALGQESGGASAPLVLPTPEVPRTPSVPETPPVLKILRIEPAAGAAARQNLLIYSLENAFDDMDRDENNLISGAEFAEFYNTSAENTVFIAYDRDRNYLIDRGEFFSLSIDGKPLEPEENGLIDDLRPSPFYP